MWVFKEFFYVNCCVIKGCVSFCLCGFNGFYKFIFVVNYVYIMIIVVVSGFNDDWVINVFCNGFVVFGVVC